MSHIFVSVHIKSRLLLIFFIKKIIIMVGGGGKTTAEKLYDDDIKLYICTISIKEIGY